MLLFLGGGDVPIHPFLLEDVVRLAAGEHPQHACLVTNPWRISQLKLYYPKAYLEVMNVYI